MNHVRTTRVAAIAVTAALFLTACGQRPGIHVEDNIQGDTVVAQPQAPAGGAGAGNGAAAPADTGTSTGTTGDAAGTTGGTSAGTTGSAAGTTGRVGTSGSAQSGSSTTSNGTTTTGTQDGGSAGGGATTQPTTAPQQGQQEQQPSGTQQPTGTDRTGVSDDKIVLAVHAPVTGAAPLPTTSFEKTSDLYWRWQTEHEKRTILGRSTVEVKFADDKYTPDNARQVCRQLAAESFLVVGGGGTDQIQACGQLAGVQRFPYFSPGVTEAGLDGNDWYFAAAMTYRQQGILLAQYLAKHFPGKKVAMVVTDTPNFADAQQGFEQGVQQYGLNYYGALKHAKGDTSWYNSFASKLDEDGVEVVYILTSPVDYIDFAKQAKQSGYGPFQYVGVGVSMGLNAVLGTGCDNDAVNGGIFFSPFPGLDKAHELEPDFFAAAQAFGTPSDDIALALWGLAKVQDAMFTRYQQVFGNDLTREDFRALVEASQFQTNLFPNIAYSPQNHFGGQQVHVLQADCSKGQYVTLDTFASGF